MDQWLRERGVLHEGDAESLAFLDELRRSCEREERANAAVLRGQAEAMETMRAELGALQKQALLPDPADPRKVDFVSTCWSLGCDPAQFFPAIDRKFRHVGELNSTLRLQSDQNLALRRSIQHLNELIGECDACKLDGDLAGKVELLIAKTAEYHGRTKGAGGGPEEARRLACLLEQLRELDSLDRALDRFAHLPPSVPECLRLIAAAQQELGAWEARRALHLQQQK